MLFKNLLLKKKPLKNIVKKNLLLKIFIVEKKAS